MAPFGGTGTGESTLLLDMDSRHPELVPLAVLKGVLGKRSGVLADRRQSGNWERRTKYCLLSLD
jgi:hypothetical protein